ncbi:delta(14)-sterol reductase TM7SF2-like [Haemaphysalis longicornis]
MAKPGGQELSSPRHSLDERFKEKLSAAGEQSQCVFPLGQPPPWSKHRARPAPAKPIRPPPRAQPGKARLERVQPGTAPQGKLLPGRARHAPRPALAVREGGAVPEPSAEVDGPQVTGGQESRPQVSGLQESGKEDSGQDNEGRVEVAGTHHSVQDVRHPSAGKKDGKAYGSEPEVSDHVLLGKSFNRDSRTKTPSPSKVPSESSAVVRRSNPLSTTSLAASLRAVNLGNTLTRRSTATPAVNDQAGYSSPLRLPEHSSQGSATMQSSLEGEHGKGDPSTSKKQHLKLSTTGGVQGVSTLRFGRVRVSVRVPPSVLATIRALFCLAFLPPMVTLPYMLCRMEQCTVMEAPAIPKDVALYFHWMLYPGYAVFLLLQALVQALPLGRKVQGFPSKMLMHHTAYEYSLNGWANLLVTVGAFGVLTYYGFPVTIPYRYNLQLLLTILVFANVLSLLLYVKGRWAPWDHVYPPGNIGNRLNDFVEGRELSPRIDKGYDLATLCFRCGLLTWVVLLGSMAWDEYSAPGSFDHGFALSASCQLIYVCMFFFDEEYFLSSAFVTDEGMGYVSVVSKLVLVPFLGVLPPKFLHEQRPPTLPIYCLAFIAAIFLLGLIGMHLAHKHKYRFRRNWPDPDCRGLGVDYLADAYGNRLTMSGLWGLVRHPNYLADLLCHLAFALPCGHHHLLPYYSVITSTVFLVARTIEVEGRCADRYGHLWTRYTEIVKYRLVPFVF